jgi:hypothetical protein
LQAHNWIKIGYLFENSVLLEEGVRGDPKVAVHLRVIIIQEGLLHMDHVVEGEIFGAEGLRRVLLQIQMRGHSFTKTMSSISMLSIHGCVSEAYLVAEHLHIKSEMRDLLKLA